MFAYRNVLVGLLLATMLVGCASVPLSTMWQMRNFGAEDFLAIEASELAARVSISEAYVPDFDSFKLAVTLGHNEQEWDEQFALRLVEQYPRTVSGGWFSDDREEMVYSLVLTDGAVAAFRRQQAVFHETEPTRASASVTLRFLEFPDNYEPAVVTIELRVSEDDGYFPLIREATLELKAD